MSRFNLSKKKRVVQFRMIFRVGKKEREKRKGGKRKERKN